jgi:hypothetical protein
VAINALEINPERLWDSLERSAEIGRFRDVGLRRLALSAEDKQMRDLFVTWAKDAGCTNEIDRLGNIFARRAGSDASLPPVAIGSHLDTQICGGRYDGILGVLARLADDISAGVESLRRKADRDRYQLELARLSRSCEAILHADAIVKDARTEAELYDGICEVIVGKAGYRLAGVGLVEHDTARSIRTVALAGGGVRTADMMKVALNWADDPGSRGPIGEAVRSGEIRIAQQRGIDPALESWRGLLESFGMNIGATAALPLLIEGRVFGVLAVFSEHENAFSSDEVAMLRRLAEHLSYGVGSLRGRGRPQ